MYVDNVKPQVSVRLYKELVDTVFLLADAVNYAAGSGFAVAGLAKQTLGICKKRNILIWKGNEKNIYFLHKIWIVKSLYKEYALV